MKNLSRILSVILCFAPLTVVNAAGPVATTAGSNLTAYNPSNAYNNQWANLSNGRYDSANAPSAKADFGNCNALVLRCAQPKCSNGGCADASVASAIVTGCVQSNSSCKQYGDDLVQYMTAQLVASSNAKINEQNLAAQQAAAAAAAQQSEQQMQQMQYQMQQMQQQMAQQAAESQQQLQTALAEQAAQNAAALESMKSAATEAAKETEAGITQYQQDAIDRGVSADIIERQKIAGQIMTEIENAEVSLKEMKVAMNNAFEYAKCDARGNNCAGPKRIKKWRELSTEFLEPYDNAIDKMYDALVIAQTVGIDLSQIYMMLNNSCNSWGQYLCPRLSQGEVVYPASGNGQKGIPRVCTAGYDKACSKKTGDDYKNCIADLQQSQCQPCTLIKVLTESAEDKDAVYEGWVNADYSTANGNTTVVACASSALDSSALFARRTKNKNGAGLVDIDKLDTWLNQVEPSKKYGNTELFEYCNASNSMKDLEKALRTRVVDEKDLCRKDYGKTAKSDYDAGCGYINPVYAICDVHPYNAGKTNMLVKLSDGNNCFSKDACQCSNKMDNPEKILWAVKSDNACDVKWCSDGYKPKGKDGCLYDDTWKQDDKTNGANYNAEREAYDNAVRSLYGDTKEIIGLKTTVISQQMYKQYEYLNATLRRLKTQLEKATLTATLQAAGAKSEGGSSSGGLLGGSKADSDKEIILAGAENCWNAGSSSVAYSCIQNNLNLIKSNASTNKKKAAQQLNKTVVVAGQWDIHAQKKTVTIGNDKKEVSDCDVFESGSPSDKDKITTCANALSIAVARKIDDERKEANRYSRDR